ncbi:protein S100-A6-like [Lithobates pipiens]
MREGRTALPRPQAHPPIRWLHGVWGCPGGVYIGHGTVTGTTPAEFSSPSSKKPDHIENMTAPDLTVEEMMTLMIVKFEEYAKKRDSDGNTLNTDELYDLAIAEFPTISGSGKKDEVLKGIIGKMDANNDKKVTFKEFMSFSATVAIVLRESLKK